jgi:hypothetical protein
MKETKFVDGLRCSLCVDKLATALYPQEASVVKVESPATRFAADGCIEESWRFRASTCDDVWDPSSAVVFHWSPLCDACGEDTKNMWRYFADKGFPNRVMEKMVMPIPTSTHGHSVTWVEDMGRPGCRKDEP